jgi:hypothetical protein
LDAQNAGNDISVIQISKIFWGSTPQTPPFKHGILATHVTRALIYSASDLEEIWRKFWKFEGNSEEIHKSEPYF